LLAATVTRVSEQTGVGIALLVPQVASQFGLQATLEHALDQLGDQTSAAGELKLPRVDLSEQAIKGSAGGQLGGGRNPARRSPTSLRTRLNLNIRLQLQISDRLRSRQEKILSDSTLTQTI